jgi:hypothetical protein
MRVKQLTNEINIQKWSTLIEECRNSGVKITNWCKEKGVSKSQYYYWQKKICNTVCENLPVLKEKQIPANVPTFAEVKIPVSNDLNDIALTLSLNNTSIQIHNHANEDTIAAALRIIKIL